jgi:hypothetical protein
MNVRSIEITAKGQIRVKWLQESGTPEPQERAITGAPIVGIPLGDAIRAMLPLVGEAAHLPAELREELRFKSLTLRENAKGVETVTLAFTYLLGGESMVAVKLPAMETHWSKTSAPHMVKVEPPLQAAIDAVLTVARDWAGKAGSVGA